jgi:hypothetical protein
LTLSPSTARRQDPSLNPPNSGNIWAWDASAPIFGGAGKAPLFTTIFFLDHGKNSSEAIDQYVYAYGLDNNWRSQQAMYLGRVPAGSVQTRSAWQFFAGTDVSGTPVWISDIPRRSLSSPTPSCCIR